MQVKFLKGSCKWPFFNLILFPNNETFFSVWHSSSSLIRLNIAVCLVRSGNLTPKLKKLLNFVNCSGCLNNISHEIGIIINNVLLYLLVSVGTAYFTKASADATGLVATKQASRDSAYSIYTKLRLLLPKRTTA